MLHSFLVICCAVLAQPATERSEDEAQLSAQVRQLVLQLDANELAKREAAERALIDLGPPALRLLPAITPRTPAEVKQRLQRVMTAIETAEAQAITQATRVTLQGTMSLQEALQKLEEQTGNKVVGAEDRQAELELDLQDVPYWVALDQVLDQAGLTINPFGGSPGALTLSAASDQQVARSESAGYTGIFRFEPTRIEAVRDLRNPQVQGLKVTLSISWEPRIAPISLSQQLEQIEAVTDTGDQLVADQRPAQLSASTESTISAVELDLPFELPARKATKISSLQGTIMALVPGRLETFEFTDFAGAEHMEQRRAGVSVMLENVRKNLDLYEIRVRVRFDEAANALESHRGWIYNNEAYLVSPGGQRLENAGLQATRQEENEVGIAYLFDVQDLNQYTFVYKTPALIVRMPVDYQLKNIPLP